MSASVWWIRRDLRLDDNPALNAALEQGSTVIPVFILDERLLRVSAPARQSFLFDGLRHLDADLRQRGSRLVVRAGPPETVLAGLLAESGTRAIFAEEDFTPFARRRDALVSAKLPLQLVSGLTVHHPQAVLKPDGRPYTVFTPFSRFWRALPLPQPRPARSGALPPVPDLPSLPIPESAPGPFFPAGETEARRRLSAFLDGPVFEYAADRNRLDLDGTSVLSPYFRFGMLSPARALHACLLAARTAPDEPARRGCETWINELVWREFYQSILYHFPHVLQTAFNPALRAVPWRDSPADLQSWQQGRTGFPVVDAAMRQMLETGWMHNRARMIVASFLVKDLLINWQAGERWFMQHLVDGDPAANNGGWQWTAGTGTDAAPYFRIFNPVSQGKKFDPDGLYVRRWVPELANVPLEYLHEPWLMPEDIQQGSDCRIGWNYPTPIVDHAAARPRALAAYQASRAQGTRTQSDTHS